MTDLQLLNDIVESLREFVKSDAITMKLGNEYKDLKVYPQDLPEKYDEDDEELRNYVVVMIADEDVVDDEWRVEVHFSINIEDMDNDHSGWVNVMYLMNEIYRHFIKVGIVAPVVVINVLDPDKSQHTQAVVGKEYDVVNKMVVIEDTGVLLDKVVVSENETTYKADDDYVASINSEGYLVIALTNDGAASSLQKLNISYVKLNPDGVTAEDIIGGIDEKGVRSGIELLDEVFINTGVIPAIVTAPVFSKQKEVAAALEAKVRLIGSLHNAKAYVDIDSSESGAVSVFNVAKVKEKNVPQSELIDACWPMVNKNGNMLAFSSFAAALAQAVAAENGDIPDGIDNRELLVDGVCTEDGTPVKVIQGDANSYLNANGIITAIRLPEWKAWGNNTAMYPASKDPTKRWSKCVMMLNYLQNRFKTEYLSKVGRNAKVKFIKGIVDEYNASLNALAPDYLAGGEIIFDTAKNPPSSMLEGHYIFSTRYADYTPAEYIENDFVYDAQILTDTMEGGDE